VSRVEKNHDLFKKRLLDLGEAAGVCVKLAVTFADVDKLLLKSVDLFAIRYHTVGVEFG